jgi:hypothetical protein
VGLSDADIELAQALADTASIAIFQSQATRDAALREGQLQHALDSRVVIEQAKGIISERAGVGMDEAFSRLRNFSRNTNRRLSEVATGLVEGTLDIDSVAAKRPRTLPPSSTAPDRTPSAHRAGPPGRRTRPPDRAVGRLEPPGPVDPPPPGR